MSIYYVSANGCDKADGLTEATAWQTIQKVNATIVPGDEIRFRCGDTFYGHIEPPKTGTKEAQIVYTSYGEGAKPVISQFKTINAGAWEKVSENIYKLDMADTSKYTGNISEINANAGYIVADGHLYARKYFELEALKKQWDFYTDNENNNVLYVYSEGSPDTIAKEIKIACRICGMSMGSYVNVYGLVFVGTGAHGINGGGKYMIIDNCEFHDIGGSRLDGYGDGKTRYGNGVEFWATSTDSVVKNCKFSGTYDVAITMQGPLNDGVSWKNMYFENNLFWNCTQALEIWATDKNPNPEKGFINCHFTNNICVDTGDCWGTTVRPNVAVATPLLIYGIECMACDLTITGNIFTGSELNTVFKSGGCTAIPKDYKMYGNTVIRKKGQLIAHKPNNVSDEQQAEFEAKFLRENYVMDFEDCNK